MDSNESVELSQDVTSLGIVFAPNTSAGAGSKAPSHRFSLILPEPLTGLTLEGAIFTSDENGVRSYKVGIPGGRFPALKADKMRIEHAGRIVRLADDDPQGLMKLARWEPAIKTAFHAYQTSGITEQRVSL